MELAEAKTETAVDLAVEVVMVATDRERVVAAGTAPEVGMVAMATALHCRPRRRDWR